MISINHICSFHIFSCTFSSSFCLLFSSFFFQKLKDVMRDGRKIGTLEIQAKLLHVTVNRKESQTQARHLLRQLKVDHRMSGRRRRSMTTKSKIIRRSNTTSKSRGKSRDRKYGDRKIHRSNNRKHRRRRRRRLLLGVRISKGRDLIAMNSNQVLHLLLFVYTNTLLLNGFCFLILLFFSSLSLFFLVIDE